MGAWQEVPSAETQSTVCACSGSLIACTPHSDNHALGLLGMDRHTRHSQEGGLWYTGTGSLSHFRTDAETWVPVLLQGSCLGAGPITRCLLA